MNPDHTTFNQAGIHAPIVRELEWSHSMFMMEKCDDMLEREFYMRWTQKYGCINNLLKHQIECHSFSHAMTLRNKFEMQFCLSVLNDTQTSVLSWVNQKKLSHV